MRSLLLYLATVSTSYSKKPKHQHPGNVEGTTIKGRDSIEFSIKGQQYNSSDVSPLHSYQMRVNSKKG